MKLAIISGEINTKMLEDAIYRANVIGTKLVLKSIVI